MAAGPILIILAGPNGAGKTTLYELVVSRLTDAAYVNPDRLVLDALGRHATSVDDARLGQELAEARRRELMAAGRSLVTESTFSHPSKLVLVREGKALGYRVQVFHVNVRSVEHAIARVAARVDEGGHPVPEANLRGRYERNQPLIREAVLLADDGLVFDNSALGRPPRRLIRFADGKATAIDPDLPGWAQALYGGDL